MGRNTALALAALSLFLLLFPLSHHRPGMPATLKADEPAYYLMALSLIHDGDLRCEPQDLERLYLEFPHLPVQNLILATDDGWHTVFFGKPYLFSLLAAPLTALWGADGMIAFNMLLLVAMIWMGAFYLARYNDDAPAALFAAGFFLLSTAWAYVFWLHPEVLDMFATAACLFFGLMAAEPRPGEPEDVPLGRRGLWFLVLSGAALAVGVYHKPMIAAAGLPVVFELLRRKRWAGLGTWLAGATLTIALAAGLSMALTGYPTAYLGIDRAGFTVDSPHHLPIEPIDAVPAEEAEDLAGRSAGWEWIFRLPEVDFGELRENLGYFLWGRHTGLFLYQPFSLLALGLFFAFSRRSGVRWVALGALAAVALFFQLFISFNWHGGGGFVGNRYFVIVYPAFLFLVTRIRPPAILVAGYALGGWLLGSILLAPAGAIVPFPTLQAHVRNAPFQLFPVEHSLAEIPGYHGEVAGEIWFWGRKDQFQIVDGEFWLQGGDEVELWLQADRPLGKLAFEVRGPVPGNEVRIALGETREHLVVGPSIQRLEIEPGRPTLKRWQPVWTPEPREIELYLYRLEIESALGELPAWRGEGKKAFYLGTALRFLGEERPEETATDES